ncbi:NAD(P)-binding protein [Poronia punctata]|nr:NAD(P)-binding protein [Poronia punctata]
MSTIKKVAIFGASGNFGTPITAALINAGFTLTIFTRPNSTSSFPPGIPIVKVDYSDEEGLAKELKGQDAVVSVLGPAAVGCGKGMVDAAFKAGVGRFILNDFGWGFGENALPEFKSIGEKRSIAWERAMELASSSPSSPFTWTGITIGCPIDWALAKFPKMGFNLDTHQATIYDSGTEYFTGTTLSGIGQAVVGVLLNAAEETTRNRFVKVRSVMTCQNDILAALQKREKEGKEWSIEYSTAKQVLDEGRRKYENGEGGWALDLLVYQLFAPGERRCVVVGDGEEDLKDCRLLGVLQEGVDDVVGKAMGRVRG